MYIVMVRFGNGEVETVGKYKDGTMATNKAREAAKYYTDFSGTVHVVKA